MAGLDERAEDNGGGVAQGAVIHAPIMVSRACTRPAADRLGSSRAGGVRKRSSDHMPGKGIDDCGAAESEGHPGGDAPWRGCSGGGRADDDRLHGRKRVVMSGKVLAKFHPAIRGWRLGVLRAGFLLLLRELPP
jgi:hypothetical protein